MKITDARRSYRRMIAVYDLLFGPALARGRREALARLNREGGGRTVLEIGFGTGLSLPLHRPDNRVIGADVSMEMLARSRRRIVPGGATVGLAIMPAERLALPDASVDAVLALYVMTVVEDSAKVLADCARVLRPGGRMIMVSHLAADPGTLMDLVERLVAPLARWLGWDSHMALRDLGLDRVPALRVEAVRRIGIFTLIELVRDPEPAAAADWTPSPARRSEPADA